MATFKRRFHRNDIHDTLTKTGSVTRSITPSPNFLNVLEQSGYTIQQALKDILDNSIDADSTKISLQIGEETLNDEKHPFVVITDNGCGMTPDILFGALCLGADEAELGDKNKNGGTLGKFGTGMKSSLANLQGKNTIYTKVKDGDLIKVHYDKEVIQKYWDDKTEWGITIDTGTPEDIEFFNKHTNDSEQGTVIKIYKIKRFKHTSSSKKAGIMKKTIGQTFRRFIHNGQFSFEVNGTEIEAFDPCGYDIPFEYNGKTHKSELMAELEFSNLEYTDPNGKKKRDGYLRYRSFLLPQKDVIDEADIAKAFGWNMHNQGISVMRNNREIQSRGWLGMSLTDSYLTRFRVEIDFSSEMDNEWGADFKKTSVDPNEYILGKIQNQFDADKARARKAFQATTKSNKIPPALTDIMKSVNNFLKRQDKLIGTLPGNVKKADPENKGTGEKRGQYNQRQPTDKIFWNLSSDMPGWKWYETTTLDSQKKIVAIDINMNHPMYEYILSLTPHAGILVIQFLQLYTGHFGREDAVSCLTNAEERTLLRGSFDTAAEKQGDQLRKLCPLAPKV